MHAWWVLAMIFGLGAQLDLGPVGAVVCAIAALGVAWVARRSGSGILAVLVVALLGVSAAGAGGIWQALAPAPPKVLVGEVVQMLPSGAKTQMVVAPDGTPGWRVRLWVPHRLSARFAPGARVIFHGRLQRPKPTDNPGTPDFEAMADRERVRWVGFGTPRLMAPAVGPSRWLSEARGAARERLASVERRFGASVIAGLALGDRGQTPEAAKQAFAALGTGHLLAVSGLHVGAVSALCFFVGAALGRRALAVFPRRWGAIAGLLAAAGFVALTGFSVSATRAGIMVGVVLGGQLLGRTGSPLNLLGLAALLLLLGDPQAWRGVGFQLSFAAVFALLTLHAKRRGPVGALWLTLVAWAATAPIQAWHFGTTAPASPVGNLILTPAAALLVPFALVALAVAPVWAAPLEWASAAAEGLVALAEALAEWLGPEQIVGAHAAPLLAVPIVILWAWRASPLGMARLEGAEAVGAWPRRTRVKVGLGVVSVATCLTVASFWLAPPPTTVDFIAVGQGDAALVRTDGKAVLVDAGPDPDARAIQGVLRHLGVRRLDSIVISHAHPDHYLGLAALAARWPVGHVAHNGRSGSVAWQAALAQAERHGATIEPAKDRQWRWGQTDFTLTLAEAPETFTENDASLALRVEGPGASVLFTGDLEHRGEARLGASGVRPVTVLKAAHHGSRTSSDADLLALLRPKLTVFPVGRHNRFGFPHPEVVARHEAIGAQTRRLDVHGWTRVDLETAQVRSYHGAPLRLGR